MFRRLSATLTTLVLALGLGIVTAGPSSAVGCYGDYCSGKDPSSTGCAADAYTAAAVDFTGGRLEVRYSPTCKTNWSRLQIYPGGFAYHLAAVQDTGYRQDVDWAASVGEGTYWTPMIYSPVHKVQGQASTTCYGLFDCIINGHYVTAWA